MPQLRLPHAMIADVQEDEEQGKRTVVLNVDEEYLFEMLDSINPKNIIKYLDMRGIQHREPSQIHLQFVDAKKVSNFHKKRLRHKIYRIMSEQEKLNAIINK